MRTQSNFFKCKKEFAFSFRIFALKKFPFLSSDSAARLANFQAIESDRVVSVLLTKNGSPPSSFDEDMSFHDFVRLKGLDVLE